MLQLLRDAWSPNCIRRTTLLQIFIVSLAFLAIVRIYPCGAVYHHDYSPQQAGDSFSGESFGENDKKLQTVAFTQEHIYRMTMYLSAENYAKGDTVTFRLYDDKFSCVYEVEYACSRIAKDGYLCAEPDLDVEPGLSYYYEVLVPAESGIVLSVPIASLTELAQAENGILYIDGIINTEYSLVTDFEYTRPLSVAVGIFYILMILAAALSLYVALLWLFERLEPYAAVVWRYARWLAAGVTAVAAAVIFVQAVVRNVFGGKIADRVVYTLGIVSGIFWISCALWMPRTRRKVSSLPAGRQASLIWRNYLQTVCFGFLFYALCQYENAYKEYYHLTNTRWMLVFFGLACLLIKKEKEILCIPSYVWLGVSIIGSVLYCRGFADEQELYLAKLTAAVVVVWGLVIINALIYCKKEAFLRIKKPFFALWLLFFILMWVFRYEKTWPFTATLPFAALLLFDLDAAGRSRLLKNLVNGILLSFGLVVLFSLHHRPYYYWIYYRYGMLFHTVACTGMYLSTVSAALIAKLYARWGDSDTLVKKTIGELFTLSAAAVFMLFTISRTAMLTTMINLLLIMGLSAYLYRKSLLRMVKECCVMLCAVVITFPLAFSAVRMLPAIAHDVVIYDIEDQDEGYTIYNSDEIDSDKYMNISRFFTLFFYRFGVTQAMGIEAQPVQDTLLAYMGHERLPIAAQEEEDKSYELGEANDDVSNGRFDVYRDYLQGLNLTGHKDMDADEGDHGHAHNSYIQVAHDFGIPAGIVFLLICVYTLIESVRFYIQNGRKYRDSIVPLSMSVSFCVMSLTEWAFHPCIPAGFAFLLVQMLLMQRTEKR